MTPRKTVTLVLCLILTIRGTDIWNEDFTADCTSRQDSALSTLTNWGVFAQYGNTISDSITDNQYSEVGCFTTDLFPDNLPTGLTFIDLYGVCIKREVLSLASGKYKLSFNYYQDPQSQTALEDLKIYVIDQATNMPINIGGETTMTLRNQVYLYKMINFEVSAAVSDLFIVFCDTLFNDITGVTNVKVSDWPALTCTEDQKIDLDSNPICVLSQTVTDSIDCFLFKSDTECGGCNQLVETTHLVDLNTPAKGCISQSNTNYDSYCSIYSYVNDFKCQTCTYATGESFNSLKVIINSAPVYRCPDEPSLKQQFCTEYVFIFTYLSCQTCPYKLMPGANNIRVCVKDLIPDCKFYKPDASCDPCASGIPSTGVVCPKTAVSYFPYCLKATNIGGGYACIVCLTGYVLNFRNQCLKMVKFCANYRLKICTTCIQGYVMFQGNCYEPIADCQAYELNGLCKNCSQGFKLIKNGTCIQQVMILCKQWQYQSNGICLQGNIVNCIRYESGLGNCKECREGYRLKTGRQCEIVCPKDTQYERWTVRNGLCFWEDLRCKNAHPDGYCYDCKDGFYAYFGKCYKIDNNV